MKALRHPLLWLAIAFVVLPYLMPGASLWSGHPFPLKAGFVDLATTIVIFAIFALGFNLLFGHVGELSFGQAMFFGLASYATALYTKGFTVALFGNEHLTITHNPGSNALIALIVSLVIVGVWAFVLARLIVPRSSGIYFSMITMAFAQVIFFIEYKWSAMTGGEDGIQAISRPNLPGLPDGYLSSSIHFYYFAAIVVFIAAALVWWLIESPFGTVLHAIRENRQRASFLGYDVRKFRINAFFLSALFPAVGGWLWCYYQQAINPDAGSIDYSGRVVMMSLLGGIHSFFGPMLGALVYWELQNNVSQVTKYWPAWIGVVFAFFVLVAPRGIWGLVEDVQHYGFQTFLKRLFSREARYSADVADERPEQDADVTSATTATPLTASEASK